MAKYLHPELTNHAETEYGGICLCTQEIVRLISEFEVNLVDTVSFKQVWATKLRPYLKAQSNKIKIHTEKL